MPSWSIHLAISKIVSLSLNLDETLLSYGSLIPDVDKNSKVSRYTAHYYDEESYFPQCVSERMINIDKFLRDYNHLMRNPLILGYYCHLLTDNFYNQKVYEKCWILNEEWRLKGIKLKDGKIKLLNDKNAKRLKQKYKHYDFELYGKYLYRFGLVCKSFNKNQINCQLNKLKNNFLELKDIEFRLSYLKTQFKEKNKFTLKEIILKDKSFKLFEKEEMDSMFVECVNLVIRECKKYYEN